MYCPEVHCMGVMQRLSCKDVNYYACPICHSVWVEKEEYYIKIIKFDRTHFLIKKHDKILIGDEAIEDNEIRYCPVCEKEEIKTQLFRKPFMYGFNKEICKKGHGGFISGWKIFKIKECKKRVKKIVIVTLISGFSILGILFGPIELRSLIYTGLIIGFGVVLYLHFS